jgi:signal transduction histidine kinase/ActR/RegA family two-component response regulator
MKEGRATLDETLEFMRAQCIRYDSLVASEQASDQIQLLDKANGLRSRMADQGDVASQALLERYADEQRLSGIIITDENLQPVTAVYEDGSAFSDWAEILSDTALVDVMDYPQKNYVSSTELGGGNYYYAALGLTERRGVLLCYTEQLENVETSTRLSIETLLSGYRLEKGGIILVTDGETILSSNVDEQVGQKVADYPLLANHALEISAENATAFQEGGVRYLSQSGKCKSYYLYALFPSSELFHQRTFALGYVLIFYILFGMVVAIVRQQESKHSNQNKMDFLHRMSHDIRTPINGIRGMVRIADSCPENIEKQTECREKIWEASGFLIDLVNDVLDMSKLESGEMQLAEDPFDLQELIRNLHVVLENQAAEQKVTLNIEPAEGEHFNLIGSPLHVRRILVNVLSNAIKYNKENGSVTFTCRELKGKVTAPGRTVFEFVCKDTGVGMSREFQKRMFDQFSQENAVGEVSHHGTGLGLAIVKSLVQEMDGTIRCESERDVGSTFTITLPFTIDENAKTAPPPPPPVEEDKKALQDVSILLVEDNELNMEIAEFILEDEGATTMEAWNGQEAVDIFSKSQPGEIQVILMDMMMPVMDGEHAARAIRALDRPDAKTVPILALTANTFDADVQAALNAGMNAHLAKPIDPDILRKEILHHLGDKE